ncbi:uncharacterized protein [Solanum lycopersicum]|uniref:uncharacterized protein isoform X6 n=1 Tax=Solanum lycopersicum TaxID=4081 RepID=UPI000532DD82|nr:uncharacterized protein LOC101252325 isoform X3 [Solanum lycopersicum]
MGEQNQPNFVGTQWAFLGSTNDSFYLAGHEFNNQYMTEVGIDGIHYVPVPSPQWIHDQQTPHNYVEYLAENVVSEVDASVEATGFSLLEGSADIISQEIRYPRPYYEGVPPNCLNSSEHQRGALTWELRGNVRHASGPCSDASAAGSSYSSKSSRKARAALSDRDLSRSRLGGEPTSIPFVFLEGCGHYILDEQQIEPLEDTMGKLLEVNPSLATQLLESKSLFVMPLALAEGLHHHE